MMSSIPKYCGSCRVAARCFRTITVSLARGDPRLAKELPDRPMSDQRVFSGNRSYRYKGGVADEGDRDKNRPLSHIAQLQRIASCLFWKRPQC